MKSSDTHDETRAATIAAFVRAVATAGDSPTVISRVAENAAYVDLCRHIVALDAADQVPPLLEEACRRAGISPPRLRSRLIPVARALHLAPEAREATYYQVLGVPPDSDAEDIRRAYRRRARDLHPDLQPQKTSGHQAFAELTEAYETLRDPDAKEAYDTRRSPAADWYEPAAGAPPPRPRRARFAAVIVAVLLLVAAALVLDQLDRRQARRSALQAARHVVVRPVPAPPRPPQAAAAPGRTQAPSATSEAGDPQPARESPDGPPSVAPTLYGPAQPDTPPAAAHDRPAAPALAPDHEAPVPARGDLAKTESGEAAAPVRPRLVIFHAGGDSVRLSRELAGRLAGAGYPPARVGPSPGTLGRSSSVRYFHSADRDAARALRDAVQAFLATGTPPAQRSVGLKNLSRRYPRQERGLLEVWLNTGATATAAAQAVQAAPLPRPAAVDAGGEAPPTEARIRAFIHDYCRAYETRDPSHLAALFDPAATENGRPFRDLLPRYRATMERLEALSYKIEMEGWEACGDRSALCVAGRFTAWGRMVDQKEYESRGTIALDIVPYGGSYRVCRLDYRIDK